MKQDRALPLPAATPLAANPLAVNLMKSPFGVDRHRPAFSWTVCDPEENQGQTAYRLVVAESAVRIGVGSYLFDSGWVESDCNTAVTPEGLVPLLADNALYYWQVAVRNRKGRVSDLSNPAPFSTAVGKGWVSTEGIWWGANGDPASRSLFAFLRTEVTLSAAEYAALDRVILSVTATSPEPTRQYVYSLSVNGCSVGVGPTRLGREPDGTAVLYYHSYDVTPHLTEGANCLSAICYATEGKSFLCQVTAYFTDGSHRVLTNSGADAASWRALNGDPVFRPDQSIGTWYFVAHANNMDMTEYPTGFDRVGFEDSAWDIPALCGPILQGLEEGAVLASPEVAPVKSYDAPREGIAVSYLKEEICVVDLDAEIIGHLRFGVTVPEPCTLRVYYGEQKNPDGTVKYAMNTGNVYAEEWRLRAGEQVVETVDLLAFRYVQIENCPVAVTPDMVTGVELRAPFWGEEASFRSDSPLLNEIYGLMAHTVRVTTQDLYVDSQSRERGAYEGDMLINLPAAYAFVSDYSTGRFSAEYLYTHRTWPAEYILFAVLAAKADYMTTGDAASLKRYYGILREKNFTKHLNPTLGLLSSGNPNPSGFDAVLVDWPPSERDGYDMEVTYSTVLNALAARAYAELSEIAAVTGHGEDAEAFASLSACIRSALLERCYDGERGVFCDGVRGDGTPSPHVTQHATAFALYCGIYRDKAMAHRLAASIAAAGKIRMSVYGAYFLLMGLYETGHGEIANRLLLDEDAAEGARTWAYMLRGMGATVTTEAWNMTNKPNMTLSHPWGAAPAHGITGGIFGIKPTSPGYATFDVRLQTAGLGQGSLTLPTVKGAIAVSFEAGDAFTATVTVPANTKATVYLPASAGTRLTSEGREILAAFCEGYLSLTVGSGTWGYRVER